jgi:hypothetical protein
MPKNKKSFVWDYLVKVSDYKQCKKSNYIDKTPSATTTAMASHLLLKHNIRRTDADNVDQTQQQAAAGQRGSITQFAIPQRSREEWMTRLVVIDGLSAHQVAKSEFIGVACQSMRLASVKSHTGVSNIVTGYIEKMKEDTRTEITETLSQGKRFSIVTDEWTSIRNRRYLNVCAVSSSSCLNLELARCKGSVIAKVVAAMVQERNSLTKWLYVCTVQY